MVGCWSSISNVIVLSSTELDICNAKGLIPVVADRTVADCNEGGVGVIRGRVTFELVLVLAATDCSGEGVGVIGGGVVFVKFPPPPGRGVDGSGLGVMGVSVCVGWAIGLTIVIAASGVADSMACALLIRSSTLASASGSGCKP